MLEMITFPTLISINYNETLLHVDDATKRYSNHEKVIPDTQCKARRVKKENPMNQKVSIPNENRTIMIERRDCLPSWWQ